MGDHDAAIDNGRKQAYESAGEDTHDAWVRQKDEEEKNSGYKIAVYHLGDHLEGISGRLYG